MKISYIYKIINIINGKIYIGSTNDFKKRFEEHKRKLKNNSHHSYKLQQSYNKHGKDSFEYVIIEQCPLVDKLNREQFYLDTLTPFYNISKSSSAPMEGRKHSKESLQKMSKPRPDHRGENCYMWGKKWTPEMRKAILAKRNGSKRNDETKARMRATAILKNRKESLLKSIEESKEPIGDNIGNTFGSMTEASKFHNISIQTICDILKRRHYKTLKGVTFNYLDKENLPYIHNIVNGEYRGITFDNRRFNWVYNITTRDKKQVRVKCDNREDAIDKYRKRYYNEYRIILCDQITSS